jgi:ferredoxin
MSQTHIDADTDACIGAGNCFVTAPGIFDIDQDGVVVVLRADLADADDVAAADAARAGCPAAAITLTSA